MGGRKTNDAIPSWSGYNYQGKVMLFYILLFINKKIEEGLSLDSFSVELEKKEDFVIYNNNVPISFHQVKATLSKKKLSGYSKALDKMLCHRAESGANDAECFLISATEIIDWSELHNTYASLVTLFKYEGNHIGVTAVPDLIKKQLKNYNSAIDNEVVYFELCDLIDEKISLLHSKGKSSNYKIEFKNIIERINSSIIKSDAKISSKQKELVYNHITSNIYSALNEYCTMKCNTSAEFCINDCGAKKHYDDLINTNIWVWARILNPNKPLDWGILNYVENMPKDGYKDNLYDLFSHGKYNDVHFDDSMTFFNDIYYNSKNKKIIPTLMSLRPSADLSEKYISKTISDIKQNEYISPYISGNVITADTNGKVFNTNKDRITFVGCTDESKEYQHITDMQPQIIIVDREQVIQRLEGK